MTRNRRNIKVDPETFETLKDRKPDDQTWPEFLTEATE